MKQQTGYTCSYCHLTLKTESGYRRHSCKKKKIADELGTDVVRTAYKLWSFWFLYNKFSKKRERTAHEFRSSPYFSYFCTLAESIKGVWMFDKNDYVIWLCQKRVPARDWGDKTLIERYKREIQVRGKGLERAALTLEAAMLWCIERDLPLTKFFSEFPTNDFLLWLESGKMSPWFLLTAPGRDVLIERLTDAQIRKMLEYVNMDYWEERLARQADEVSEINQIYAEVGLCDTMNLPESTSSRSAIED